MYIFVRNNLSRRQTTFAQHSLGSSSPTLVQDRMAPSGLSLYANLLDGAHSDSKSDTTSDPHDQDHRSQEQQKALGLDKQQISSGRY